MILDRDKDIIKQNETYLEIYQKAYKYAEQQITLCPERPINGGLVEIRYVQDLGLVRPGFHSTGLKSINETMVFFPKDLYWKVPTDELLTQNHDLIVNSFLERVLKRARELKAIDIIIGYHYS